MEKLLKYREIVTNLVRGRVQREATYLPPRHSKYIADTERDIYIHLYYEWKDYQYHYGVLVHLDIINEKIWLQRNITEDEIIDELKAAGVPDEDIVLGTVHPAMR